MILCIDQGNKYTGINGKVNDGRPHIVNASSEMNQIGNSIKNCLGLRYTTILINCHSHTQGYNAVIRDNLLKIIKIRK